MNHLWSITTGTFVPAMSTPEKHGQVIITTLSLPQLIDTLIEDHRSRSLYKDRTPLDYRVEDYSDELRIYVKDRASGRFRILVNLQYEGTADE